MRVNVFLRNRVLEIPALDVAGNLVGRGGDFIGFGVRKQPNLGEHTGVSLASANVVTVKPAVEGDRFGELLHAPVSAAFEAGAPRLLAHHLPHSMILPSGYS